MKISATVENGLNQNKIIVTTNNELKEISIPSKSSGYGSSVNGGELLLLALATCFCNDLYREALKRDITLSYVEVVFTGNFGGEGEPGTDFQYKTIVKSDAPSEEIDRLIRHTDKVAEIHNTLRKGLAITLSL